MLAELSLTSCSMLAIALSVSFCQDAIDVDVKTPETTTLKILSPLPIEIPSVPIYTPGVVSFNEVFPL